MKRFTSIILAAALALFATPAFAGATNAAFHARSTLKYVTCSVNVGATASASGIVLCGVQAAGKIVDVQLYQAAAGVGGTSWSVALNKNGSAVTTTAGVLALASGTNKMVQTARAPDIANGLAAITLPSGATRPVLSSTAATVAVARGDLLTIDVTNSGTYSTAFSGQVRVLIDPTY